MTIGREHTFQAFCVNPLAIDISSERAALMKDLGCMQEAVNAYAQAINLHPHVPELYANLASVFKDGGHHDQAIRNYTQVEQMGERKGGKT